MRAERKRRELMRVLKELASQRSDFSVVGSRFAPNHSQTEALKAALGQEFTLIQGPPGNCIGQVSVIF